MKWAPITPNGADGSLIQLHADGTFSLGGFPFDQEAAITDGTFNGWRVDKAPGEDEELIVQTNPPMRFKYVDGQWYQKRPITTAATIPANEQQAIPNTRDVKGPDWLAAGMVLLLFTLVSIFLEAAYIKWRGYQNQIEGAIEPPTSPPPIPVIPPPSPAHQPSHEVQFANACSQPLKLYLSYNNSTGIADAGVYDFAPNVSSYLAGSDSPVRMKVTGGEVFYFAKMVNPDRDYSWNGEFERLVNGTSYKMRRAVASAGDQARISISVNCPNFWRIKAKNSCNEEVNVALHYDSIEPGVGFITDYWWSVKPGAETTFPLTRGGYAETASSDLYFFARSKTHNWGKRDDERGKRVSVEGEDLNMPFQELALADADRHINLTCVP